MDPQTSLAGLYRAEESEGGHDYVAGWVVDTDDNVAGAVQNRRPPGVVTPKPPAQGTGGAAKLSPRPGVQGQPVQSPKNPPQGKKGSKFTQEDQDEENRNLEVNLGSQGGSPLLAAVIHQVKRFQSGARPVGPIEQQTFARLAKGPEAQLTQYVKNWDGLPAKTAPGRPRHRRRPVAAQPAADGRIGQGADAVGPPRPAAGRWDPGRPVGSADHHQVRQQDRRAEARTTSS